MKSYRRIVKTLLDEYSISSQQKILRLVTQTCRVIKMGQSSIILENTHVHPHGINNSLKDHKHHFLEIHIPYSGAGFVRTNGKKHFFCFGEFAVNPPEQIHYWEMTQAPLPMLILWLRLEQVEKPADPLDQLLADFFATGRIVHALPKEVFLNYHEMLKESATPRLGMEIALHNYLALIILALARATVSSRQIKTEIRLEPVARDDRLIFIVDQFLKDNLANECQLEDIARQISMSPRSLTRKYRDIKGRSIGEELNRIRMYQAEELLRESDLPAKEVAWQCGFPDQHYFCRKFKEFHDISPGVYRKKLTPV
ncbi:MAG: AraC family transcriptional regulator [Kiritimatiellales bacterium]